MTCSTSRTCSGAGLEVSGLEQKLRARAEGVGRYVDAYRRYCWPVRSLEDLRLAPFHLLATEWW
jgi:protein phosphatase